MYERELTTQGLENEFQKKSGLPAGIQIANRQKGEAVKTINPMLNTKTQRITLSACTANTAGWKWRGKDRHTSSPAH
jgi:hypothetical protein